jgi:hypothetical protein
LLPDYSQDTANSTISWTLFNEIVVETVPANHISQAEFSGRSAWITSLSFSFPQKQIPLGTRAFNVPGRKHLKRRTLLLIHPGISLAPRFFPKNIETEV